MWQIPAHNAVPSLHRFLRWHSPFSDAGAVHHNVCYTGKLWSILDPINSGAARPRTDYVVHSKSLHVRPKQKCSFVAFIGRTQSVFRLLSIDTHHFAYALFLKSSSYNRTRFYSVSHWPKQRAIKITPTPWKLSGGAGTAYESHFLPLRCLKHHCTLGSLSQLVPF